MKMALNLFMLLVATVLISACGNHILGEQESQRNAMDEELRGTWTSLCEGKRVHTLTVEVDKMSLAGTDYYDAECQSPVRTVRQDGTYKLAHTFKEGVLNSIVFTS